ncbi:MAG: hypothetical protein ABIJ47_06250 [Candidatus Bathyarchaeota archaeon]
MFWLNADTPTRIWKLHREGCLFCRPHESRAKGLGAMRGSGGWFSFKTLEEAHVFYESQSERYIWQPCKICKPDQT